MVSVFGSRSSKDDKPAAPVTADSSQPRDPQAPKGRPTPKRSQAQSQRRMVTAPTTRKEAAKRTREARRADMAKRQEALAGGDERYLPARDKGPVRRFARDYVDARWSMAEFFLPAAILILVLSFLGGQAQALSLMLWMAVIVLIVIDSFILAFRFKKQLKERYPDESHRGATAYALMRTLQMRRMRLPKPQVRRGERP
nr:DUF3043 domain-containing protein [Streptomyces coryli]